MKHDRFVLLEDSHLPDFNDKYGDLAHEVSNKFAILEDSTQSFIENIIQFFCIIIVNQLAKRDLRGAQSVDVITRSIAVVIQRVLERNIKAFADYGINIDNTGEKTNE